VAKSGVTSKTAKTAKRPLRSSEVVRELILNSARTSFADSGFAGATTRKIATQAGVVENLIYKQFGTKQALFDVAVVGPFQDAVDSFIERWGPRSAAPHSPETTARDYIEALYNMLQDHADLLIALMKHGRDERPLLPLLEDLERVAVQELAAQEWTGVDIPVLVRLHFGMVAFNAAFGESLYPPGELAPNRDRIIAETTAFFVHGTAHRPKT
jgi:AcrR family transcriptional regulator